MSAIYHSLAGGNFFQNWTDTGLIATDDDWSGVPSLQGFRGDGLTGSTGTDPQTILADGSATPLDVNADETNPDTFTSGGIAEFSGLSDPTVALQGAGTADAPHLVLYMDTTGVTGVTVSNLGVSPVTPHIMATSRPRKPSPIATRNLDGSMLSGTRAMCPPK